MHKCRMDTAQSGSWLSSKMALQASALMAFPASFPDRCGRCQQRIRKGQLIVKLATPAKLPITERYNWVKQRTEGGGYRLLRYTHARCPGVPNALSNQRQERDHEVLEPECPICGQREPHVCRESL